MPKIIHEDWGFDSKDISNKKRMIQNRIRCKNGWEMLIRSK